MYIHARIYNIFRIIRFKPVSFARIAFLWRRGTIYPLTNKSPFCVRTQYTLRRLFSFPVLIHAFFVLFVWCLLLLFFILCYIDTL